MALRFCTLKDSSEFWVMGSAKCCAGTPTSHAVGLGLYEVPTSSHKSMCKGSSDSTLDTGVVATSDGGGSGVGGINVLELKSQVKCAPRLFFVMRLVEQLLRGKQPLASDSFATTSSIQGKSS